MRVSDGKTSESDGETSESDRKDLRVICGTAMACVGRAEPDSVGSVSHSQRGRQVVEK